MTQKISVLMVNKSITSKTKHKKAKKRDREIQTENYKELKNSVYHGQKTINILKKSIQIQKKKNKFSRNYHAH